MGSTEDFPGHPSFHALSKRGNVHSVMNNTKWDELRLAMHNLGELSPSWRTNDVNGYICPWDGDWFHHFRQGGYATIEWVEIRTKTAEQTAAVLESLRKIHLPGLRIDEGFRVYGYARDGVAINYL